jgi:hypothetical protein
VLSRFLSALGDLAYLGRRALPPVAPLRDYWVRVKVRLEPHLLHTDGSSLVGYFRFFCVRAAPLSVLLLVASCVTDGAILEHHVEPRDVRAMRRAVVRLLFRPFGEGVWHESGRILFKRWGEG